MKKSKVDQIKGLKKSEVSDKPSMRFTEGKLTIKESRGFRGYSITDTRVCYYENKSFYKQ